MQADSEERGCFELDPDDGGSQPAIDDGLIEVQPLLDEARRTWDVLQRDLEGWRLRRRLLY